MKKYKDLYSHVPDKLYLQLRYWAMMGEKLDLKDPKTLNEKEQWLKLYNRNPLFTTMADKYEAKKYVAGIIGEKYILPLLGIWEDVDDIDFERLPDRFVLKCTHDSGGLVICKDKKNLDIDAAKKKIDHSLKTNFYLEGREWSYKNIKPRIIAEPYICDDSSVPSEEQELSDFKFYCFDGYVDCVMYCFDRASGDTKFFFFDKDWNLKRINKRGKEAPEDFALPRPPCLDEMFAVAAKLSKGIPFVRVDLYQSDGRVYFGELTLYPKSGFDTNYLPETNRYFGSLIDLSLAKNYSKEKYN